MLPPEYLNDLGFRSRFEREANLIAELEHEAVVPLYEYGIHEGQPYIVMTYMPNGSLADRLLQGPLSPTETAQVLERIAAALDYAHRQGIIHRDLKASNVLFDENEMAYLADFGIALHGESPLHPIVASGTPNYMSPEQALKEKEVDPRSDVYSLGIIIFEMLTGGLPFDGDTPMSIILKHIHDRPPSLGAINPELPAALDPVLHRALAKEPQERYPSAEEFVDAFQYALHQAGSGSQAAPVQMVSPTEQDVPIRLEPAEVVQQPGIFPTGTSSHQPGIPTLALKPVFQSDPAATRFREGQYILALSLVTWLAVVLAAATVTFARGRELMPVLNLQIVYNPSAVAVVNISTEPLRLTNLAFERVSDQGIVTAKFSANKWDQVNLSSLETLPSGGCYQLLWSEADDLKLSTEESPAMPPICELSQGWLVALEEDWLFWTPEGVGSVFRVVQNGRLIHTCRIAEGRCRFHLPQTEAQESD